jgi:hypothetical protein
VRSAFCVRRGRERENQLPNSNVLCALVRMRCRTRARVAMCSSKSIEDQNRATRVAPQRTLDCTTLLDSKMKGSCVIYRAWVSQCPFLRSSKCLRCCVVMIAKLYRNGRCSPHTNNWILIVHTPAGIHIHTVTKDCSACCPSVLTLQYWLRYKPVQKSRDAL